MSANTYATSFGARVGRRLRFYRRSWVWRPRQYWAGVGSRVTRYRALPWRSRAGARQT